jgi:methyl-accepting chemotaxis protein
MQITIFWRIVSGYALILVLCVGASSYSIIQLGELSGTARTALDTDNRMIASEEKLTDAFLSEVRYAGQFLIAHTSALNEQFRQFDSDFIGYLSEIKSRAASAELQTRLSRIEEFHHRYHDLFEQEVRYLRARQPYAESRFKQERGKIFETTLQELERLKRQLQTNLHEKLQAIESVARTARTIAAVTTVILLGLGIALSFLISRSITEPLVKLTRSATRNTAADPAAARGEFRIPEIRALSDALIRSKQSIEKVARANAAFAETVADQLRTPLISLKQRLSYLEDELSPALAAEQKTTFDILAEEIERLVERSSQFGSLAKAKGEMASFAEPATVIRSSESSTRLGNVRQACNAISERFKSLIFGKAKLSGN